MAKSTVKLQADIQWTIRYRRTPEETYQNTIRTIIPIAKADQVAHLVAVLKVRTKE